MGLLYERLRERSVSLPGKETFLFTFKNRVTALSPSQSFCLSLSERQRSLSLAQRGGDLSVSLKGRQRALSLSVNARERSFFMDKEICLSLSLCPLSVSQRERERVLSFRHGEAGTSDSPSLGQRQWSFSLKEPKLSHSPSRRY